MLTTHPPRHRDDAAARKDVRRVLGLGEIVLDDRSGYLEKLEILQKRREQKRTVQDKTKNQGSEAVGAIRRKGGR